MHDCNDERERMRTSIPSLPILNRHQGTTRRARARVAYVTWGPRVRPSLPSLSLRASLLEKTEFVSNSAPPSFALSHPRIRTYEYI